MRTSFPRIVFNVMQMLVLVGFGFIQFAETLIEGFGWPFTETITLGGCFSESQKYGWPFTFYEVISKCHTCCTGTSLPYSRFDDFFLVMDIVYLLGIILISFYFVKTTVKIIKHIANFKMSNA